jgi:hypothetical protein
VGNRATSEPKQESKTRERRHEIVGATHTHTRTHIPTHTHVTLNSISPSYTCGRRDATLSESSQFNHDSGWDVSRRYPDYTERVHVVLSREGGSGRVPTSLGLGLTKRP